MYYIKDMFTKARRIVYWRIYGLQTIIIVIIIQYAADEAFQFRMRIWDSPSGLCVYVYQCTMNPSLIDGADRSSFTLTSEIRFFLSQLWYLSIYIWVTRSSAANRLPICIIKYASNANKILNLKRALNIHSLIRFERVVAHRECFLLWSECMVFVNVWPVADSFHRGRRIYFDFVTWSMPAYFDIHIFNVSINRDCYRDTLSSKCSNSFIISFKYK